jgi:hypothetical protein
MVHASLAILFNARHDSPSTRAQIPNSNSMFDSAHNARGRRDL